MNPVIIEHGISVGGQIVPGTERVIRDLTLSDDARLRGRHRAMWVPGELGTERRAPVINKLVGHWTGGEAGAKSYADDGPFVVTGTKLRLGKSGQPLKAAFHFLIGACAPDDEWAPIWQTCDLTIACVHVGQRAVYSSSIGVEVVNAGFPGPTDSRARPRLQRVVAGRMRTVLAYYPGQLRSWAWLANTLATAPLVRSARIEIPREVPVNASGRPFDRRFTGAVQRRWAGAQEHCHLHTTTKLDGGTQLVEALQADGWEPIVIA
jgi:hypothetical protein